MSETAQVGRQVRRFGEFGPTYEVVRVTDELPDGDKLLEVVMLDSGEHVSYRLSHMLDDPKA